MLTAAEIIDTARKPLATTSDLKLYLTAHDPNEHVDEDGWTLLDHLAIHDRFAMVKTVVAAGADVSLMDETALRWTAGYSSSNMVRYLAEHGADLRALDSQARQWAADGGRLDVVDYLDDIVHISEIICSLGLTRPADLELVRKLTSDEQRLSFILSVVRSGVVTDAETLSDLISLPASGIAAYRKTGRLL